MSILSQIFNVTFNVCISPNFSLPRSRVVKNVNFDPNFKRDWNLCFFSKFYPSQVQVVKNLIFEPNFQHGSQFLDFAKFHLLHVQSGQNMIIMFKFDWKGRIKMSKFKDNLGNDQSVTGELIKMLKFECNMWESMDNVLNWGKMSRLIRMLIFGL